MKSRVVGVPGETHLIILATSDRLCVPVVQLCTLLAEMITGSLERDLGKAGQTIGLRKNPRKSRRTSMWETKVNIGVGERTAVNLFKWAQALGVSSSDLFVSCSLMTLHQMREGRVKGFASERDGHTGSCWPHELQNYVDSLRATLKRAEVGGDDAASSEE